MAQNPLDAPGNIGQYRLGLRFANAAAQTGPLVSFRWSPGVAAGVARIWRVTVSAVITTAFTAAQVLDLQLQKATGWTTNDTGGTVIAFTGGSNKQRTSLPVTQVTQIMTGTATVTPGTRTLDTNPLSTLVLPIGGSTGNVVLNPSLLQNLLLPETTPWGEFPLDLQNNEGFVVSPITALGAAGVVVWAFQLAWSEGY